MLRIVVPLVLSLAATARAVHYHPPPFDYSAASQAQIQFALENKYDETGPGAQQPETAFNTYATLEDALIGYLDDPDTKLPEYERNRALQKLVRPDYDRHTQEYGGLRQELDSKLQYESQQSYENYKPQYENQVLKRYYPKTVEEYTGYNKPKIPVPVLTKVNVPKKFYKPSLNYQDSRLLKQLEREKEIAEPYRLRKIQPLRADPAAHFTRDHDLQNAHDQFDSHPKYTYSYGVHVPDTGDTKSAHETREGGKVRGYYSFVDPDGRQRTVHYTADDEQGFTATVEREFQY